MSEPTDARAESDAREGPAGAPRTETILLPLDSSELAETAVPYAVELARLFNARLVLLRVLEEIRPVFDTTRRDMILLDEANPRAELRSPAFLAPVITRLEHEGIEPHAVVRLGDPSAAILEEAALQPSPVIVMTSHGHGGLGRLIAGGVATQVLRHAPCPTLIIRSRAAAAPQQVSFDRITLTLDGSPVAERALPLAVALARASQGSLELVRVAETLRDELPSDATSPRALPPQRAALHHASRLETSARDYLRRVAQDLRGEGLDVSWQLLSGDPQRQLEEYLTQEGPDVVVLATHGHGVLTRWLLGSVADRLMTATDVPLLLLRVQEPLAEEFERGLE